MVRKVYTARNGARYIKLANGQCRFISGASRQYLNRIRNMRGGGCGGDHDQRGGNSGFELKLSETDPGLASFWNLVLAQENLNEEIPDHTDRDVRIDIINTTLHEGSYYVKFTTNLAWAAAVKLLIFVMSNSGTEPSDDSMMTVTNRVNGEVLFNERMEDIDWEHPIWDDLGLDMVNIFK